MMFRKLRQWLENAFTSDYFTFRQIASMLVTLIMDSFFIMIINVLSSSMVSSVGEAAMAAVNMVGTINMLVSLTFTSLATGGSIVVARAKGSHDMMSLRNAITQSISICTLISLVVSAALYVLGEPLVNVLYPEVEPLLTEYAVRYLRLVCISLPPYAMFCAIFNSFRSVGDTKSALFLTIVINGAHLVGSFIFINGMQLGVDGAGWSLIAARVLGVIVAVLWMFRVHNEFHVRFRDVFRFSRKIVSEIIHLGIPIASESILLQGGMLLVQIYLARLTTMEMAAHGIVSAIFNLFCSTCNAMISLAATVCGQCVGARQYELARKYCLKIIQAGRFVVLALTSLYFALMPLWFLLYAPSEAAKPIIFTSLLIGGVSLCVFGCDSNIIPSALRSAGDVIFPSIVSLSTLFVGRIVLGYILTIVVGIGVPGIWLALGAEMLIRAIVLRKRVTGSAWYRNHQMKQA
ncbi:MAG: MATE family efflux transporter [Clostridia bacterium]|nr:MATE family efflux transporter [Clostridia bacterium]